MLRYYRTHYGPNNAVAVVVGDVTAAEALRIVQKHFGPIKPIPSPRRSTPSSRPSVASAA